MQVMYIKIVDKYCERELETHPKIPTTIFLHRTYWYEYRLS